ncbi:MAG: ABC transporter permease [Oscillospiraceae bacterium]|nr:ABC transporter permease [Oscillospiraceae bacterium]
MKQVIARLKASGDSGLSVLSSLIAVLAGLLVGLVVLLITDAPQAFPAFRHILTFGFQEIRNVGQVLYFATPLILTGLSVGFAYKTGLFNIGASGQYTFGAFVAIWMGLELTFLPPPIRIPLSLLGAMAAGALWGAIPGLLKAFRNVHEVISCIMTNWVGIFLVNFIIMQTIFDPMRNATRTVPLDSNMPGWGLGELFQGGASRPSSVNSGIIVAILAAILVYIILEKTKFGYELKACGFNKDAAKYAGISEKRNIVSSMMISGALAGLGGGLHFLSGAGVEMQVANVLATEGFTGISVALLGLNNPIGIIFGGMLIAYLHMGGFQMQLFGFVPEIIEMVIAVIIYFCAFVLLIKLFLAHRMKKKTLPNEGGTHTGPPPDAGEPNRKEEDEGGAGA